MKRSDRHRLSHQKEDLDKSILHFTTAIFLRPIHAEHPFSVVQILFCIAAGLLERSRDYKQPGIEYAVEYIRYILRSPPSSFDTPRTVVTQELIQALGTQVKLGVGNGTQDIKEMVVLCNELLSSNKPEVVSAAALTFGWAVYKLLAARRLPTELQDEVIECFRDAVKACQPASYKVMFMLAELIGRRFLQKHSPGDYEEAIAILEKLLEPGGCPGSFRRGPSSLASDLACARSDFLREPEYAEVATSLLREELNSPALDERSRIKCISRLASQIRLRFEAYGLDESLDEINGYISQLVNASSSSTSDLPEAEYAGGFIEDVLETYSAIDIQQKIQHLENLLSTTPLGTEHDNKPSIYLQSLDYCYRSKFHRTNDISDLEEAIKYRHLEVDATRVDDPRRIDSFSRLRDLLFFAFEKTGKINYLNESIEVNYVILEFRIDLQDTYKLVLYLCTREHLLGWREDLPDCHEAIRLILSVINDQHAQVSAWVPDRFQLSCMWAMIARRIGHPTTLAAYKMAMSLMQKFFSFAPTVSTQHNRLVALEECFRTTPLNCASYHIDLGRLEEAVEMLEQGRALLWSEMRGLRTPVCQLIKEDSPLAKRFSEINQELETLTIAVTPSGRPEVKDGVHQSKGGTDPFGRLLIKRKKLVEERDALISQIQSRPELEGFLAAPSFDTLRSAASRGPVIIINHCMWRCDIIIILYNSLPCSIPTTENFITRSNQLRDELVEARKRGLDSVEYQRALSSVLKGLYELVGEPVIKKLCESGVPEQSRIWWCPTSVFCSLPLHAMGPIPSSNGCDRYFSDLYIPSYTPSLSALIESRQSSLQMPTRPSLLLVAQPDDMLPGVNGEIKVIRQALHARLTVASLVSGEATPSSVLEGLQGCRFAHFACHGVLETGKPFDASFKVHRGSRLTLLDIVRSRLPDAEFAFLSCCHAAEITENSIADESLHLTAAMQYCGFRSVVGTMWEMADVDGRDLAKTFYKSLFSSQETGVPYYERSAGALRDATQRLRKKRGISLERWVNFVHYGA